MKWLERNHIHYSSPYQIISCRRGWEVWLYSRQSSGCLGREVPNLDAAKFIAQAHKDKETAKALLELARELHA